MLSTYDFNAHGRGTIGVRFSGPLSKLATRIQPFWDRPVIDKTGLTGNYAWTVTFSMNALQPGDAPPIDVAVVEQLGFKLERGTGPYEVLVIDSIERPTPD